MSPIVVNTPQAYKLLLSSTAKSKIILFEPVDNALHVFVFISHFAILLTVIPPASVKIPPAYKLFELSNARA